MPFGGKAGAEVKKKKHIEVKSKTKKSLLNLQKCLEWPVLMAPRSAIILGKKISQVVSVMARLASSSTSVGPLCLPTRVTRDSFLMSKRFC